MRNKYETALRRILFHSADVAPAIVERYLATVALKGHRDAKEQALKADYAPLVRAIPNLYADFALKVLVPPQGPEERSWDLDRTDYGVGREVRLYPATHAQGPFWLLLSTDEAAGLRLVHGVTNAAVDEWIREARHGTPVRASRTPLPQRIDLPSGPREYWGDDRVYQWFRPNGSAPDAVCSALMALEVWMEREVDSGRDAGELFDTVLDGGRCVAVPGICLGVALGAPERCFEAALPLVAAPALWRFEVPRFVSDQMPTFDVSFLGQHRTEQRLRAARDRAPQRKLEIRSLAATYALLPDGERVAAFRAATDRLTLEPPFCFEDERQDASCAATLREQMERCYAVCDPANYHVENRGSHLEVTVRPPRELQERDAAAIARLGESIAPLELVTWAFKALEKGEIPTGLTVEAALQKAKALNGPADAAALSAGIELFDFRRLAMVGVAAASVAIDFEAVRETGNASWCRETLLSASAATLTMDLVNPSGGALFDPFVAVALGLAGLLRSDGVDSAGQVGRLRRALLWLRGALPASPTRAVMRERLLRLVVAPDASVSAAALRGLASLGDSQPDLLWRGLALSLAVAVQPRRTRESWDHREKAEWTRRDGLIQQAIGGTAQPTLPRVHPSENEYLDTKRVMASLHALPLKRVVSQADVRRAILGLLVELMTWTLEMNTHSEDERHHSSQEPLEWNDAFLEWAAGLCALLTPTEVEQYVLGPIRGAWGAAPGLTASLQRGYLWQRIGLLEPLTGAAAAEWETICGWVLDSQRVASEMGRAFPDRDVECAVARIVYVSFGESMLPTTWPHARRFQSLVEKWVRIAAHSPHAFASLVTFLAGPGGCFLPEPGLRWLQHAVAGAKDARVTIGTGDGLAQLLQGMWSKSEQTIRLDRESLHRYAYLVDQLVSGGVPLASRLQQELTGRS